MHQDDLSVVLHEYQDVIVALEAGLIGQWGEMHSSEKMLKVYDPSSKKLVESPEHYNKIIDKWLDLLKDTDIPVLIRKMEDYINFANANSFKGKNVKHENVGEYIPTSGMKEYNLGFFNDSYLGSTTDRGTFSKHETRATAIKWLKSQTKHNLYGGEMAIWAVDKKHKEINTACACPCFPAGVLAYQKGDAIWHRESQINCARSKSPPILPRWRRAAR